MSNESLPNTKSIEVQYLSEVVKADPDWRRDFLLTVEDERRPTVRQNWQTRGPYAT